MSPLGAGQLGIVVNPAGAEINRAWDAKASPRWGEVESAQPTG
jgi:hypothetical protein